MHRCIHDSKMSEESSCGSQASVTRDYSIQLFKTDRTPAIRMEGTLPCDASVHDLANDIVLRGHAQAGSFRIVMKGMQPPLPLTMTFALSDFHQRVDKWGLFTTRMTVILEELGPHDKEFAENFQLLCKFCEGRYPSERIKRALKHTEGNVEAAMNFLLDQAKVNDQTMSRLGLRRHDAVPVAMPQFIWGQMFDDLAEQFQKEFPVGCDGATIKYSCFRDCFTNRDCLRLRSKSEFLAHVLPFHYAARSLHLTRKRLRLLQPPHLLHHRPVPPPPTLKPSGVHGSARLNICSSAMRAKLAFGLCKLQASVAGKDGTISGEEKMAHMIALRICSVSCCRIQVIRAPPVLIRFGCEFWG